MRSLLVVVPLLLLLSVACGDGEPAQRTPTSEMAPTATTPPSASTRDEQRATARSLPEPPGASLRNPEALVPSSVEEGLGPPGLILSYFVQDEPDAVEQFYRRELPKLGWTLEEPPALDTTDALTFANQNTVVSFVKGEVRVAAVVSPNEKDPSRGATFLQVVVEER